MELTNWNKKNWILTTLFASLSVAGVNAQPYAYVANLSGNNISVVNTATDTSVATINGVGTSPSALAVTPDGAFVYVPCQGINKVSVIATATNTVVAQITVGTTPVQLAINPNGAQVYVVNRGSNSISVIDTASKTVIKTIAVGSRPLVVAYNADGTRAYVANLWAANVSIIDTASNTVVGTFTTPGQPNAIAVGPTGTVYVSNGNTNSLTVHSSTGTLQSTVTGFVSPNWIALNPAGSRLVISNGNGSSVAVVDTSSLTVIKTISTGTIPTSVAITPDGTKAYVTNEYALSLSVIDLGTNAIIKNMAYIGAYPIGVAIQPPVTGPPPPPPCVFTLSSTSASFTAVGGAGSVNVSPSASCGSWTASSNAPWITITPPAGGTGAGAVNYTVAPNPSTSSQQGTMTIAGQTFTVNEAGIVCSYSISATSGSFSSSGGPGSVNVTAPAGCTWTATSNNGWATISSGTPGNGNGTLAFSVGANASSLTRNGSLTIAGQTYSIAQTGVACTYTLSALSNSFSSSGGPGNVTVTAPAGCQWTAASNAGFVNITSGASGTGNGSVGYSVTANASSLPQNGTLTIAGQTYSISESGVTCTYSLSATSNTFSAAGGPGSVNVTAPAGCQWTALSNVGWTTVDSGSSGTGNGTVNYTVTTNASTSGQTGTLTIAGQTYTINQSGAACNFSLSSSSASMGSGAGGGSVNLTTTSGCAWSATSDSAWLTIQPAASGSGSGTVSYNTAANPGVGSRTGNLTIAGQNFSVTQTGAPFTSIHVRCGGPDFTDGTGTTWVSDGATDFSVTGATIANATGQQALYQSDAWAAGTLQYQYTVPNGSFTVQLKFAEFYVMSVGQRTFNVVVNGNTVYSAFDILAHAPFKTAYDLQIPVVVNNGQITVQLVPVTGTPKLNALAIF